MAIKDYTIVTLLEPINDGAHMSLGACYAQKGNLEKAIPEYSKSIELNPLNIFAALGKMEAEICLRRYNDAIVTYETLNRDTISLKEKVIASSLLYIALTLDGKPYEEDIAPLENWDVKLSGFHDWCTVEIDRHLSELEKEGFNPDRVAQAKEIQDLKFKKHFE